MPAGLSISDQAAAAARVRRLEQPGRCWGQPKSQPPRASGTTKDAPGAHEELPGAAAHQYEQRGQPQTSKPGWQ